MRKIIICTLLLLIFFAAPVNAEEHVRIIIDGNELTNFSTPPILVNERTLVPVRDVFERVGGVVGWHEGHRQVSLFYGEHVLVMTIDEYIANLNGTFFEMHTPPIIYNERTMVPVRFPAEVFDFYVGWDDNERAVIINTNGENNNGQALNLPDISDIPINPLPRLPYYGVDPDKEEVPWDGSAGGDALPPPGATVRPSLNNGLARDISSAPIQTMPHPETTVTALLTPVDTGAAAYVIVASSPISEVNYFLLPDNRLVVDIHNAGTMLSGDFYAAGNVPVSGVRAAQFSQTPRVTRVVFDVVGEAEFSISLSADRALLTISFAMNNINNISTQSDPMSDTLFIQGDVLPAVNISTEGFPHFITLNIDNAVIDAPAAVFAENSVFASHYTVGNRTDGSAFINVYMRGAWPSFSLAHSGDSVAFVMHRGIEGVRYDSVNRELRISRKFPMDINNIQRIDDYLRFRNTFVLPPQAAVLGRGEISALDGFINSIAIAPCPLGNIHLTFHTERVLSFSVHEEADYYVIRAHLPRDVLPFIVVIDPGHGGSCPGAIHNGVVEKDLVLTVSHMVMQLLDADPFISAFMTRNDDTFVSLANRAEFANDLGADLFISIHANAAEYSPGVLNTTANGIETFYTISALEAANNNSINSRQLADIIQRQKIGATNATDRGVRHAPLFVVLRDTEMPAALLELGFLTNQYEAARLADTSYQWALAYSIYQGILEAFALMHRA